MVNDFLTAWLIEGDVIAAMGYVSECAYACLAQDSENPSDFDRGMAPFQLMVNLKAAHDSLGKRSSLDGLVVGTRLTKPGLRVVRQPHHAQFVVYAVPDDIATAFDCESRLTPGDPKSIKRAYGNYFGATFYVAGRRDVPVAFLWGKENGYWKIVSWQTGATDDGRTPRPNPVVEPKIVRISADPSFVQAARGFLESWLIRKDYDAAFGISRPRATRATTSSAAKANRPSLLRKKPVVGFVQRLKHQERRLGRSEASTASSRPPSRSIQRSA
jgi:hypothetical protein